MEIGFPIGFPIGSVEGVRAGGERAPESGFGDGGVADGICAGAGGGAGGGIRGRGGRRLGQAGQEQSHCMLEDLESQRFLSFWTLCVGRCGKRNSRLLGAINQCKQIAPTRSEHHEHQLGGWVVIGLHSSSGSNTCHLKKSIVQSYRKLYPKP